MSRSGVRKLQEELKHAEQDGKLDDVLRVKILEHHNRRNWTGTHAQTLKHYGLTLE